MTALLALLSVKNEIASSSFRCRSTPPRNDKHCCCVFRNSRFLIIIPLPQSKTMKKKKEKNIISRSKLRTSPRSKTRTSFEKFLNKKRVYRNKLKKASPKQKKKLLQDTDKDGLSDYEEKNIYHTDPLNPDTDNDGMKDGEEVRKNRNPLGKGTLKDLFIPHHKNNYQPHILSKKRIFYHSVGAVITKLIILFFLFVYCL